ncbi:MAG: type II secretion system F family protein, partial [Litoreibacter sp.]|nr:type II secretion system F family protein [Litoreibacter sp.]
MLQDINTFLIDLLGPLGPLIAVGLLGVTLILITLPIMLRKRVDPLDKLRDEARRKTEKKKDPGTENTKSLRHAAGTNKLDKYANFLEPQDEEELAGMKLKLLQAGYRQKSAVRTFHFAQFALGIFALILGILYVLVLGGDDMPPSMMAIHIIMPGAVGYYLPKYWVERRRQGRQDEIESGFPDSLDLMLVCVEAGQSLDQSILRVSQEMAAG